MRARQGLIAATEAGVRIIGPIHMPWAGAVLLSQGHRPPAVGRRAQRVAHHHDEDAHRSWIDRREFDNSTCAGRTARAALASAIVP